MSTDLQPKVGDKLWFQSHVRYKNSREVTVITVGRKWITLDNGFRINRETWTIDCGGYIAPGKMYRTQEEADAQIARTQRWVSIFRYICDRYNRPEHITDDDLATLERVLQIDTAHLQE